MKIMKTYRWRARRGHRNMAPMVMPVRPRRALPRLRRAFVDKHKPIRTPPPHPSNRGLTLRNRHSI